MYHYFSPKNYCNAPKSKCFNVVVKLQVSKSSRETSIYSSIQKTKNKKQNKVKWSEVKWSVKVNTLYKDNIIWSHKSVIGKIKFQAINPGRP